MTWHWQPPRAPLESALPLAALPAFQWPRLLPLQAGGARGGRVRRPAALHSARALPAVHRHNDARQGKRKAHCAADHRSGWAQRALGREAICPSSGLREHSVCVLKLLNRSRRAALLLLVGTPHRCHSLRPGTLPCALPQLQQLAHSPPHAAVGKLSGIGDRMAGKLAQAGEMLAGIEGLAIPMGGAITTGELRARTSATALMCPDQSLARLRCPLFISILHPPSASRAGAGCLCALVTSLGLGRQVVLSSTPAWSSYSLPSLACSWGVPRPGAVS